jgi:endonuclease-3
VAEFANPFRGGKAYAVVDRRAFLRTMRILEERHPAEDWARSLTPFEVLVSTILSQSTTVANERRGFEGLRLRFGRITPQALAASDEQEITEAIWHSGLARLKAPRIRETAKEILVKWGGNLDSILRLPTDEARVALMSLPGVGAKTADVVLAMAADRPVFPVDTHIARIARRWDLVRRGGYEATRTVLERWTPTEKRKAWHLVIIAHGRAVCKAGVPRCDICPVTRDCSWFRQHRARRHSRRIKSMNGDRPRQKVKNR